MEQIKIEPIIDDLYNQVKKYQYQKNASTFYNIIALKKTYHLTDYYQPLYIDAKKFIKSYLLSMENKDYGYDCMNVDKIIETITSLDTKKQLELLFFSKRLLKTKGFCDDIPAIDKHINRLRVKEAFEEKKIIKAIRLLVSSNIYCLLISILLYLLIVAVVMLPAPFRWMEIFKIHNNTFSSNSFFNCVLNALLFVAGYNTDQPVIEPLSPLGVIMYTIDISFFYLIIVNYILRKIEDYITKQ